MEALFLFILLGCIESYCKSTGTPGCKAVAKYIDTCWTVATAAIIIAIVAAIVYVFFIK